MSTTPAAQFALDYNGFDSADETEFGIKLLLNKNPISIGSGTK